VLAGTAAGLAYRVKGVRRQVSVNAVTVGDALVVASHQGLPNI